MSNRVTRFVMVLIAVAMYLNIGWAIGTYYHNYILGHEPQTFWQTVWKGGFNFYVYERQQVPLTADQILFMFFWPFCISVSLLSWVANGIYHLLWLIFAGGIAKLLGVG